MDMQRSSLIPRQLLNKSQLQAVSVPLRFVPPTLFLVIAVHFWRMSLRDVQLDRMNDLGLVSVLPPAFFLALGLITLAFFLSLYDEKIPIMLPAACVLVLILILYGTPVFLEGEPRIEAAWRHVGYIEYISRTGQVDPLLNAYFNWPGFFAAVALLTEAAGLPSALSLALWAPLVLDFLYVGPLVLIARAVSGDERLAWLTVWFFAITNWVGQDYFSPQGFSFFVHLVAIAILLTWFAVPAPAWIKRAMIRIEGQGSVRFGGPFVASLSEAKLSSGISTPIQRMACAGILIALAAMLVSSHQLTPFVTLASVTLLAAVGKCQLRGLPVLLAVMVECWIAFMAIAFMAGHIEGIVREIGKVDTIISSNLTQRFQGTAEHLFINRIRIGLTVTVWLLAFGGVVRRIRRRQFDSTLIMLAIAPFPIAAMQTYGGEMLLRVSLFALPAMVLLMARLFFASTVAASSRYARAAAVVASVALMSAFLFARYGNERTDYYSHEEVEAMAQFHQLLEAARVGAVGQSGTRPLVLLASWDVPIRYTHDEYYDYSYELGRRSRDVDDIDAWIADVTRILESNPGKATFFVSTRSAKAYLEMNTGQSQASMERQENALLASGLAIPIIRNRDATILRFVDRSG